MFDISSVSSDQEIDQLLHYLIQKDYPYESDKQKMLDVLQFLQENNFLNLDILQKLSEIIYTVNTITMDGIRFSRENLVPEWDIQWTKISPDIQSNPEKDIFIVHFQSKDEYYFTAESYLAQCQLQNKTPIQEHHLRRLVTYFPWKFIENSDFLWGNILWLLLNLNFSGWIEDRQYMRFKWVYGCMASATMNSQNTAWAYWFNAVEWWIFGIFNKTFARPARYLID